MNKEMAIVSYHRSIEFSRITFESIPFQAFTSCLCTYIFSFLTANEFNKHRIQKGFPPIVYGAFEDNVQIAKVFLKQ